jgi:hypothetical protein
MAFAPPVSTFQPHSLLLLVADLNRGILNKRMQVARLMRVSYAWVHRFQKVRLVSPSL